MSRWLLPSHEVAVGEAISSNNSSPTQWMMATREVLSTVKISRCYSSIRSNLRDKRTFKGTKSNLNRR